MNQTLDKIEQQLLEFRPEVFTNLDDTWRMLIGWQNYYRWLWAAVKVLKPLYVVEIGRERGVSASVMLDSLSQDSKLISIDINPESIFLNTINDPRLHLWVGDSIALGMKLPRGIDFLFIDGEHTNEQVEAEWSLYQWLLSDTAMVVFDDIHFNDGMTEFWNSLQGEKYDISQWHESGFGVLFYDRWAK